MPGPLHQDAEFCVVEPSSGESPVLVEVPHAGLSALATELATIAAPASSLARDADLYVDELYADAPSEGATLIYSRVSRYACDLNRAPHDLDTLATRDLPRSSRSSFAPHGLVWRSTTDGAPALHRPLSREQVEARLTRLYQPYHAQIGQLLERKRARFGYAILICGHSMPSRSRPDALGQSVARADVVPGSRGHTSADSRVIEAPAELARELGWTVAHDEPYRGGYSTGRYGRPEQGLHAVQIELARRLYMDEQSLAKKPNDFNRTREYCRSVVARIMALKLA